MDTSIYTSQLDKLFSKLNKYYRENNANLRVEKLSDLDELWASLDVEILDEIKSFMEWGTVRYLHGLNIPQGPVFERAEWFGFLDAHFSLLHSKILKRENKDIDWIQKNDYVLFAMCVVDENTGTRQDKYLLLNLTSGKVFYMKDYIRGNPGTAKIPPVKIAESFEEWLSNYVKYLKELADKIPQKVNKTLDKKLDDHKVLFNYAKKYNWDDGLENLEYIVKDPRCDLATALLIYFYSQPYSYDEKLGRELESLPFIIEDNVKSGVYKKSENKFDPRDDDGINWIDEYSKATNKSREIPQFMLDAAGV